MTIQWFPGHMAKARRQVVEKIKLIDVVIEIVDARIPYSSRNPMIDTMVGQKPRVIVLNKADLADPVKTKEWVRFYEEKGFKAVVLDAHKGVGVANISVAAKEATKEKFDKMKAKGIKPRAIRALILGIPNVGKSTIINRLAKKNMAKTGDRPGVTTAQQWIKVGKELELLDTPGILWPKFENQAIGYRLAATGAIKDTILNLQDIALFIFKFLYENYPNVLKERYGIEEYPEDVVDMFDHVGKLRGCIMSGGVVNYDKVAELVVRELRQKLLGGITLETPNDIALYEAEDEKNKNKTNRKEK